MLCYGQQGLCSTTEDQDYVVLRTDKNYCATDKHGICSDTNRRGVCSATDRQGVCSATDRIELCSATERQ